MTTLDRFHCTRFTVGRLHKVTLDLLKYVHVQEAEEFSSIPILCIELYYIDSVSLLLVSICNTVIVLSIHTHAHMWN